MISLSNIVETNRFIDLQDETGEVTRVMPYTNLENVIGIKELTEKEHAALELLAANSYVIDDEDGKTYKIGSASGKFYCVESDVKPKDIVDQIIVIANRIASMED